MFSGWSTFIRFDSVFLFTPIIILGFGVFFPLNVEVDALKCFELLRQLEVEEWRWNTQKLNP